MFRLKHIANIRLIANRKTEQETAYIFVFCISYILRHHTVRFEISNTYRYEFSPLCIRNPHDDGYIFWSKRVDDLFHK
jgi:hypothetical protein